MNYKEKQIEELTSIIDSFHIRTYANAHGVAKFLVEKYNYQKIDKDSVVLSMEELEIIKSKRLKDENANLVEEESFKDLSIANKLIEENRVLKIENENAQKALHNYLQSRSEISKATAEKFAKLIFEKFSYDKLTHETDEDIEIHLTASELFELAKSLGVEIKE